MNIQFSFKRWFRVFLITAFFITGGCSTTTVRENPDLASATLKIDKIVMLPPEVTVTQLVFAGDNERLPEAEDSVRQTIGWSIPGILRERGYAANSFNQKTPENTGSDINFALQQIRTAYQQASRQLYEKGNVSKSESQKFRVSIGPVINPIAEFTDADALLIVNYAGYRKSGGLVAKDIITGAMVGVLTGVAPVPAKAGSAMEVALLDANTGDVLWANRGGGTLDVSSLARVLLAQFPSKNTAANPPIALKTE